MELAETVLGPVEFLTIQYYEFLRVLKHHRTGAFEGLLRDVFVVGGLVFSVEDTGGGGWEETWTGGAEVYALFSVEGQGGELQGEPG